MTTKAFLACVVESNYFKNLSGFLYLNFIFPVALNLEAIGLVQFPRIFRNLLRCEMNKNLLILGAGGHGRVDHDAFVGYGCHIACGAIVKANCVIKAYTTVENGRIIRREDTPTPQEFLEAISFEVGI